MQKTLLILVVAILISATGVALAAEGNLDLSFGQAGVVTFNKGAGSIAAAEVLQPDGRKIIVGTVPGSSNSDILVMRLNPDGTSDVSFGVAGVIIFNGPPDTADSATGVALQRDGRIVVVGQSSNGVENDILVFRLNRDGALDTSFNGSGSAQFDLGGNESASAVSLQPDGRILLTGTASNLVDNDIVIMRLTVDGQRDDSFGINGVFRYDGGGNDAGRAIALQTNGGIVVAGQSFNGANADIIILRVTASGTLDTTLNSTGFLLINRGGRDIGYAVAIQTNGKIVVTGSSSTGANVDLVVVRLNPDGVFDTSFNTNGIFVFDGVAGGADAGNAVAVQTNGKIVVTGSSSNGVNADLIVVRLNPDGTLDTTFNGSGVVKYHASAIGDAAGNAIAVQPDGMILVSGFGSTGLNSYVLVLRYDANGVLDTTFNATGVVVFRKKVNTTEAGNAVAVQPDGSIVVIGQTSQGADNDVLVLKYKSDGTRDTSFSGDGAAFFGAVGSEDIGRAVALQANGKIVVAGQTSDGGSNDVLVLRYKSDGTLDTAFNGNGTAVYNGAANNEDIGRAVAIQPDGKIVVVGQTSNGVNNNLLVLRYDSNGILDSTFGTGGVVVFGGSAGTTGRSVAIQPDGKIVAAGLMSNGTDTDVLLVRFAANGSLDATFGTGGAVTYDSGSDDAARAVALQPDGKIVVAGFRFNGTKNIALVARFNANGSLDITFGGTGSVKFNSGGPGDDIGNAIAVQADNKIVVAGTTNGSDVLLLRYNGDGTPDPVGAFSSQGVVVFDRGGTVDAGNALALQPDGKIVVAGVSNNDVLVLRFIGQKLRLLAPNGGEKLAAGSPFNIEWTSPPKSVSFNLQVSLDNGVTWSSIATDLGVSPYPWIVPTPLGTKTQCLVRVKGFDTNRARVATDQSNAVFTIETVTLTAPNGGEHFTSGETVTIIWTTHATKRPVAAIKLFYTLNGGTTWNPIDTTADPSDDGSFSWTAPPVTAEKKAKVRIVLKDSTGKTLGSDVSDASFRVSPL